MKSVYPSIVFICARWALFISFWPRPGSQSLRWGISFEQLVEHAGLTRRNRRSGLVSCLRDWWWWGQEKLWSFERKRVVLFRFMQFSPSYMKALEWVNPGFCCLGPETTSVHSKILHLPFLATHFLGVLKRGYPGYPGYPNGLFHGKYHPTKMDDN